MKTRKIARKIISCLVLINFLSYGIPLYAQEPSDGDLSAEVNTLRIKVNKLEETVY